jgi:hypothetical protein
MGNVIVRIGPLGVRGETRVPPFALFSIAVNVFKNMKMWIKVLKYIIWIKNM